MGSRYSATLCQIIKICIIQVAYYREFRKLDLSGQIQAPTKTTMKWGIVVCQSLEGVTKGRAALLKAALYRDPLYVTI